MQCTREHVHVDLTYTCMYDAESTLKFFKLQ